MARINRKTNQRVIASIGKIRIEFHLSHSQCILISMLILSSFIEIDARRKFIYIDFSNIKFLRMFPRYQFLTYL